MNGNRDIRWVQRFSNYKQAFAQLTKAVELAAERDLSDLEQEGLIQRFEYTQELAWAVLKEYFESLGETNIYGSKNAFELAIRRGLIKQGDILMSTIESRNQTSHTYNKDTADAIFYDIIQKYYDAFAELKHVLEKEQRGETQ